jgi:HNH endonuclease
MAKLSPEAVEAEMRHFDKLGLQPYLAEFGNREPNYYWVLSNQQPERGPYPAKAIARNVLGQPKPFYAGYGNGKACTLLEEAGFRIVDTREGAAEIISRQSRFQSYFDSIIATEREVIAKARIGQNFFREELMRLRGSRCQVTGITDKKLLRASHIVAWVDIEPDDPERLNPDNGLLLSALWDAAFDTGLVSFSDDGKPLFAASISQIATSALQIKILEQVDLTEGQKARLACHREKFGF